MSERQLAFTVLDGAEVGDWDVVVSAAQNALEDCPPARRGIRCERCGSTFPFPGLRDAHEARGCPAELKGRDSLAA